MSKGPICSRENIYIEYTWSLKYSTIKRDNITFTIQFMLLQLFLVTDYVITVFQEAFGRYLDINELYQQYVNSKFGEPIEYSAYLDIFSETDKIPRKMKTTRWVAFSIYLSNMLIIRRHPSFVWNMHTIVFSVLVQFYRQYREYLKNLLQYLTSFFHRTEPLQDLDRIFSKVIDFTLFWTCIFFSIILSLNFLLEWDLCFENFPPSYEFFGAETSWIFVINNLHYYFFSFWKLSHWNPVLCLGCLSKRLLNMLIIFINAVNHFSIFLCDYNKFNPFVIPLWFHFYNTIYWSKTIMN